MGSPRLKIHFHLINWKARAHDSAVLIHEHTRRLALTPAVRLVLLALLAAFSLGGGFEGSTGGSKFLERVGSWPEFSRGPAQSVALVNHYAYVAIGEGGLAVLDVADPPKPIRVEGYLPLGRTEVVRIVGTRIGVGSWFCILKPIFPCASGTVQAVVHVARRTHLLTLGNPLHRERRDVACIDPPVLTKISPGNFRKGRRDLRLSPDSERPARSPVGQSSRPRSALPRCEA